MFNFAVTPRLSDGYKHRMDTVMKTESQYHPEGSGIAVAAPETQFVVKLKEIGKSHYFPTAKQILGNLVVFFAPLPFDIDPVTVKVHNIQRVEPPVALYVARSYKVHLMNVVAAEGLGKVRVFDPFGVHKQFFLTSPSRLIVRLMVLSERSGKPSLCNSHLMAETPTWAYGSDSKRVLVAVMISFSWLLISVGLVRGALEYSLYQSEAPL
jgi:hypothetical protein